MRSVVFFKKSGGSRGSWAGRGGKAPPHFVSKDHIKIEGGFKGFEGLKGLKGASRA